MSALDKITSAVYLDIMSGLAGLTSNPTISFDQLTDDIVEERLLIIKQYSQKNLLPREDLLYSLNCIPVDCKSLDNCCTSSLNRSKPVAHFELPQIVNDFADDAIEFIGSTDKEIQFRVYRSTFWQFNQYRRRGKEIPFVYIETAPNKNNMYDAYIFNAPLLKMVSVIAIFKDPRQLEQYDCCGDLEEKENLSFINAEVKKNVTEKKLKYYRQLLIPPQPNNQVDR